MFKVQKPETVNKTFRLPKELVQELQTVAQNQGVSLNKLVQQCCEFKIFIYPIYAHKKLVQKISACDTISISNIIDVGKT